jgi:hypothetical protein
MATEELRAAFTAVETVSKQLNEIQTAADSLETEFNRLSDAMQQNSITSSGQAAALEQNARQFQQLEEDIEDAGDQLSRFAAKQQALSASSVSNAAALRVAGNAIDNSGDEALKTGGKMGVLENAMDELSVAAEALSINLGPFNVSLNNLAPLIPIAASFGTIVSVLGAFIASIGAATVAAAGFIGVGLLSFAESIESQFESITSKGEALETILRAIGDLFAQALEPLNNAQNAEFFVNTVEGVAKLVNRLAQAISQMRDSFMPLFSGISNIINSEFDAIANAVEDMMEVMNPILLDFFQFVATRIPRALRFMSRVMKDVAGPVGNLSESFSRFLQNLVNSAVQIYQGLAPAFAVAMDLAASLAAVFNTLSNGTLQLAILMGGLVLGMMKFVAAANSFARLDLLLHNVFGLPVAHSRCSQSSY